MPVALVRLYAGLRDFLPPGSPREIAWTFTAAGSVKDLLESLGVPHPEVDLVLVDGESVPFRHRVDDGSRIAAYPRFHALAFGLDGVSCVRPPAPPPRFVLDVHLGRLAALLRMLGLDAWYRNECHDDELARLSDEADRILLTRDLGLLKHGRVRHGRWLRATDPEQQAREVLDAFDLHSALAPFTRCLRCNGSLESRDKESVGPALPPRVQASHDEFRQCVDCDQVYWKGTHYARMERLVRELTGP